MNITERVETLAQPKEPLNKNLSTQAVRPTATGPGQAVAPTNGLPLLEKARTFRNAAQVRASGLYPYFRTISSAQDTEVIIEGKKVLMLGSNSYLGLTNHPKIKEAARAAVEKYGTGCAGSRFLNGTLQIHLELEEAIARWINKESVLLYSTGFQVNLGVISALVGRDEYILADKSNHASIVDGCLLSQGEFIRFPHLDLDGTREPACGSCHPEPAN